MRIFCTSRHMVAIPVLLAAALILPAPSQAFPFGNPGKRLIRKLLASPAAASANTGITVVSLTSGKTVFEQNGSKLFIPASTAKIITAYAALKALTPSYAFPTEFSTDAWISSMTVHNLYVRGYGDPSVTDADMTLQALALAARIKKITGAVIVDNSYFDDVRFGSGWMWDEGIVPWNAPISPYVLNGNCIEIVVSTRAAGAPVAAHAVPGTSYAVVLSSAVTAEGGSLSVLRREGVREDYFIVTGSMSALSAEARLRCTVSRPGLYAGTRLRELLRSYGVAVKGDVSEGTAPGAALPVGRFASRGIVEVVRTFLKDSNNLAGECLLKAAGAGRYSPPGDSAKGVAVMKETLASIGIADGSYRIADGSGLSTYNQLSPDVQVRVLRSIYEDLSYLPEFMEALPVAGRDGTLRDRLRGSPVEGNVRAKTGTMSGVSCIAGYVRTRRGDLLAFSIMMNGFTGPAKPLQDVQDKILETLWENY